MLVRFLIPGDPYVSSDPKDLYVFVRVERSLDPGLHMGTGESTPAETMHRLNCCLFQCWVPHGILCLPAIVFEFHGLCIYFSWSLAP